MAGTLGGGASACRPARESVVVYAAQDRVFAEPVFRAFERETGIVVRAVYDNEATKTTGLANRLLAERQRPRADLWWSNEEMRTRQLARLGVIGTNWVSFGRRERVLVVHTNSVAGLPQPVPLAALTNDRYRGRLAMAYPLFGTTAVHFLALRQRWGPERWEDWCRALAANRPLLVDGNSTVARLVARGQMPLGLTDSDDARAVGGDGASFTVLPLASEDGLAIPNTVAVVSGAPRPEAARRLAEYLGGPGVGAAMIAAGALDPADSGSGGPRSAGLQAGAWEALLEELEAGLRRLGGWFVR